MAEDVRVRTARFLQCIGENCEAAIIKSTGRQVTFLIGSLGEPNYHDVIPGEDGQRESRRGSEGVADNVS
jgi:hypothetical protein